MISLQAALLDMGGVILRMTNARGFPVARLDFRGRQALLRHLRACRGRARLEDLERWVFAPWRARYERRQELGCEASWTPYLDRLRREIGIESDDLSLLEAWFRPYGEQLEPIPGVEPALRDLRKMGLRLAVVSNVPLPGALYASVLERCGLRRHFEHFCFSYDCRSRKPSPAMLRQALQSLHVEASAAVMVGDRRDRDVAAGRSAGTATVWIESDDGGGPRPDAIIGSLSELPRLLQAWRR